MQAPMRRRQMRASDLVAAAMFAAEVHVQSKRERLLERNARVGHSHCAQDQTTLAPKVRQGLFRMCNVRRQPR